MMQLATFPSPIRQAQMPPLVVCLQTYFGKTSGDELSSFSELDWQTLVQTAIANGVMPLVYQMMKGLEASPIPKSHLLQLQHLHRLNGLHNISQTKELLRVLNLLQAAEIETIAFKGPALAACAYGNVALRQFNDLDLLVRLEDFWKARAVLTSNGYRPDRSVIGDTKIFVRSLQISLQYCDSEATLLNRHFQPSLLHSNPERSLDLHWGIHPRRVWDAGRFALLWQHQQSVTLMGQSVQTFSPEAMLLVLCVSVARETRKRPLKQICDIAQTIQAHPNLDWQAAMELAVELRCQKLFLLGLSVTHAVLDIPLPNLLPARIPALKISGDQILQEVAVIHPFVAKFIFHSTKFMSHFEALDRPWDAFFVLVYYLWFLWMPRDHNLEVLPLRKR